MLVLLVLVLVLVLVLLLQSPPLRQQLLLVLLTPQPLL